MEFHYLWACIVSCLTLILKNAIINYVFIKLSPFDQKHTILSQSYYATVFYFDNISFLAHVLNQLFLPNESSISLAFYRTMVLTICFQLFKKQTILWR